MNLTYADWMLARNLRPNTIEQRVEFAERVERQWGTFDVPSVRIASWLSRHVGWTALTYHTHLASIYRWQLDTGRMDRDPMTVIRRPPKPRAKPRPLTQTQVSHVMAHDDGLVHSWMMLALLAGLRAHEVAKFRGQDIDAQGIHIIGKGGQDSMIPTHPALWDLAQSYPRRGLWFPSPVRAGEHYGTGYVTQRVAERFRDVGIERGSIHRLRATYGTSLLRSGANLRVVQTLMRHSSLATTEHYLGVDEDERVTAIGLLAA